MAKQVHPDILQALNKNILPYVIGIHDMNTPLPAQLWVNGKCTHAEGVAMFNVGDHGFLTAEYFGYGDTDQPELFIEPDAGDARLVMKETQVSIPIWSIRSSYKARTMYSGVNMPSIKAYELDIQGWLGGSGDTQMPVANITLTNLPELHFPSSTLPAPDEDRDYFTMRGVTSRNAVLTLEAGDWKINLMESRANLGHQNERVYHAFLRKKDGMPFTLSEADMEDSILDALYKFLSFQCGRWITISTIVCAPANPKDWVVERAWTGRLMPWGNQPRSGWTATDWMKWPTLFREFWKLYADENSHEHLKNAIYHYVECQRIFDDNTVDYALVAAQSTLEALVRWWNGLDMHFRFGRGDHSFEDLLIKGVQKAKLGQDNVVTADTDEIRRIVKKASSHRNYIDHGRGGNLGDRVQAVVAFGMYYQDLARLLILSKLGDHGRNGRGNPYSPTFKEMPDTDMAIDSC